MNAIAIPWKKISRGLPKGRQWAAVAIVQKLGCGGLGNSNLLPGNSLGTNDNSGGIEISDIRQYIGKIILYEPFFRQSILNF
jgi:hypothetical protein